MDPSRELFTPEQLARRFGVTIGTVARWVRERRIPCVRPSRRVVRFDLDAVEAAISCTEARRGDHAE